MTSAEYRAKDYRCKCGRCGRWMRKTPTKASPATRRPSPNAGRCTDCPVRQKGQMR